MAPGTEARQEEQVVVFRLGNEHYGLDIGSVQEIIVWQPVTRIPRAPEYVEGVINLRGNVLPVLDLRKRFRLEAAQVGPQTRIVVVEVDGQILGLVVDGVSEVLRIPAEAVEPPSAVLAGAGTRFLRGVARVGERLIILLDGQRILSGDEVDAAVAAGRDEAAGAGAGTDGQVAVAAG